MRAEERAERLHLVALSNSGVIIMAVALGAVVVALVLVLISRIREHRIPDNAPLLPAPLRLALLGER